MTGMLAGASEPADAPSVHTGGRAANLFEMSIEELGKLRVTSASHRSEQLRKASSAVYVITAEHIRRSGYRSLPEIMRLAPGVEVARNNAHS